MKQRWMIVLLALMLMLGLCACDMSDEEFLSGSHTKPSQSSESNSMVLILGNHANANRLNEDSVGYEELVELLESCIEYTITNNDGEKEYTSTLHLSVIVCDGDPETEVLKYNGRTLEMTTEVNYSANGARDDSENLKELVLEVLTKRNSLRAQEPETDLAAAIIEASRILENDPGEESHLFIYDTGIVTTGSLAMGKADAKGLDIQSRDGVEAVLDQVAPGAFPDLSDVQVHFYGMGDTCNGQTDMSDDNDFKKQLQDFWDAYFRRCGVCDRDITLVYPKKSPVEHAMISEGDNAYPFVRNVVFRKSTGKAQGFTDANIGGFNANKATFKNVELAKENIRSAYENTIKPVVEDTNCKLYVVGFRAKSSLKQWGKTMDSDELSHNRAIAASDLILEMYPEISPDQIVEIDAADARIEGINSYDVDNFPEEFPGGKEWEDDPTQEKLANAQSKHRMFYLIPDVEDETCQELIRVLTQELGKTDIRP